MTICDSMMQYPKWMRIIKNDYIRKYRSAQSLQKLLSSVTVQLFSWKSVFVERHMMSSKYSSLNNTFRS